MEQLNRKERNAWQGAIAPRVASLFVVVTLGVCGGAAAQSAAPIIYNRGLASDTVNYWTPERMAAAIPVDTGLSGEPTLPAESPAPSGPPGLAGGSKPGQPASQGPGLQAQSVGVTATPIPADGAYPGPNDTYEYKAKYRRYPFSTIGKLFFTEPGVGNFVCSASVTTGGAPQNIIWTAGHCVANGGAAAFYTNWLFCPSYDSSQGGVNPAVGCWSWNYATTSGEWFNNGAFTRDYAIIGLVNHGTVINADVASVTGGLGFAWNWARDQHWFHFGYPSATPYTGGKLIATATEHRYNDTPDLLGPPTNSWGSAQTPGSSGSPVILFFQYDTPSYINGDVSYYYTNPNQYGFELQGPYFDTQVCTFWKNNTGYVGAC